MAQPRFRSGIRPGLTLFPTTVPDLHRTLNRFSPPPTRRRGFGGNFFNGMGCARPMKGSMRNRLGRTTAFFARNSWKVSIPYGVAPMPFPTPTSLTGGFSSFSLASRSSGVIERPPVPFLGQVLTTPTVSVGQLVGHFVGQRQWWPMVVDVGHFAKLQERKRCTDECQGFYCRRGDDGKGCWSRSRLSAKAQVKHSQAPVRGPRF